MSRYLCVLVLALQAMKVTSTVQFFLYPLPIPGRAISGSSPVSPITTNSIVTQTPFQNFHFQVRNVQDGTYHFGYDAGKIHRLVSFMLCRNLRR